MNAVGVRAVAGSDDLDITESEVLAPVCEEVEPFAVQGSDPLNYCVVHIAKSQ